MRRVEAANRSLTGREKIGDSPLRASPKPLKSALVVVGAGTVPIFSRPLTVAALNLVPEFSATSDTNLMM